MFAYLVERNPAAYDRLAQIPARYPDLSVKTYPADFLEVLPDILADIPPDAFTFFLIDPKGWRIDLKKMRPMLARPRSEVSFNFMFDFINRAASMRDPIVVEGLNQLIPLGDFLPRSLRVAKRAQCNSKRRIFETFVCALPRTSKAVDINDLGKGACGLEEQAFQITL
jgi:three-Cys-motif partner protein